MSHWTLLLIFITGIVAGAQNALAGGGSFVTLGMLVCSGLCRLLADGVGIRIIQLMLGHASIQQTRRYLNVTDEELRRTGSSLPSVVLFKRNLGTCARLAFD